MNILLGTSDTIELNFSNPYFIADFVLSLIFVLAITGFIAYQIKRLAVYILFGALDLLFLLGLILNLPILMISALMFIITTIIICVIINSGILRKYIAAPMKSGQKNKSTKNSYDKEKMISAIVNSIFWLSDNKVGALITFERDAPLDEYMKSGTIIDCPITPEIIETIFYEGSRLHDGAIIIRGNIITAAAVYYPPTTKAVVGKFGARHRAALGISEITDSVTVVVSEETGRISIAHGGIMDNVKKDEFERIFRNRIA